MAKPLVNLSRRQPYDPAAMLPPDLYAAGGGRVMAEMARVGQLGHYAVEQQAILDTAQRQAQTSTLGMPGGPPLPGVGPSAVLPEGFRDPLTGAFKLPDPLRKKMKRMNINPDDIEQTVTRNLMSSSGADYKTRLLFGNQAADAPNKSLQQAKEQLFAKVARAVEAEPDKKDRIMEAAFAGPNADQLLAEYDARLASDAHGGPLDKLLGFESRFGQVAKTSFGQLMSALSGGSDVVHQALGTLLGARDERGRAYTGADVTRELKELPKDVLNLQTLGAAGALTPGLRSTSKAPRVTQIERTMRTRGRGDDIADLLVPFLGPARAVDQIPGRTGDIAAELLGFGGDVALDPTTYLTLGYGGLGKGATSAAGEAAMRAKFLSHLGVEDVGGKLAKMDAFSWKNLVDNDLAAEFGPAKLAEANDVAKAFRVSAETAHASQGWAGYSAALQAQGLNADELFPRGFAAVGGEAKLGQHGPQVRGGIGLRGGIGIPGTPLQARAALNIKGGTGFSPMGTWFTKEGNRFHQLGSWTLDQVAETFHYGSQGDREWAHNNAGLFNATMEMATIGKGRLHQFQVLQDKAKAIGEGRLGKFLAADTQNNNKLIDIIEKGDRSDYWAQVPKEVRDDAEELWQLGDVGRSMAIEDDVDIPMLREATADPNSPQFLRYFPRKVLNEIGNRAGIPVTPTQVGHARARGLRAGSNILGPQGTSEMLTEGSFDEIQNVTARVLGEGIYEGNAAQTMIGYLGSVGNAAALNRTYSRLAKAGIIVPDVSDLAPGGRRSGDAVRGIWAQPGEKAQRAVKEAQVAMSGRSQQVAWLMRHRAIGMAHQAQQEAELATYAARHADADSKISSLTKTVKDKQEMLALAERNHATNKAEAVRTHRKTRQATIDSIRLQLGRTREARKTEQRLLQQLDTAHATTMASWDRGLAAQREVLAATPEGLIKDLNAQIGQLARQTTNPAGRSFHDIQAELRATKHRLAQVQGGQYVQDKRLIKRATEGALVRRQRVLETQRQAGREAATLNDQIGVAEAELREAIKASDPAAETVARTRLTGLQTDRAKVLSVAERGSAEAAELSDMVDAGEANMRMADLREAEVNSHAAGAAFEGQIGKMSEKSRVLITKLLEAHSADLVASSNSMLADAPKLKHLFRVAKEFSVVDTSVAAIPTKGLGRAAADYAQEYLTRVEQRAADQRGAWRNAVGTEDPTVAYEAARDEHTRQMATLLSREQGLARELEAARQLDPQTQVLATHQREGDQLNLFVAELHKNEHDLELWIANREEARKTQHLAAQQLGHIMEGNEELSRNVAAFQNLLEKDQATAAQAAEKAFADARIFGLMSPKIEHLAAVTGNLPFVQGGAAMPAEVARVIDNVLHHGPERQKDFLRVLNWFNTKWKRAVLMTPGSLVRRWFGNTYNAIVLAGVRPESFRKAFEAMGMSRNARRLEDIADPKLRYYMEQAHLHNIFEGQFSALAEDIQPYKTGPGHPIQSFGKALQDYAMRGEDIARLAQFIDGLDAGMGPMAARQWTGKYHFFNNELTERERTLIRPVYPFYAYLRNNYALQFHTLVAQPGKISLYGHIMRDLSAQPAGSTSPTWIEQSGGFPISKDTWLQNTLLDTAPLGLPQTVLGIAAKGPGSGGIDPTSGELVSSSSPALQAVASFGLGVDPHTGEKLTAQEVAPSQMPIRSALQALGLVNDAGKWNPRAFAAWQGLNPLGARATRAISGGLTPSQREQQGNWLLSMLVGPNLQTQTERQGRNAYRGRGRVIDDMIASMNARGVDVPTRDDLTSKERTALALRKLQDAGMLPR